MYRNPDGTFTEGWVPPNKTLGHSGGGVHSRRHPTYRVWAAMIQRCHNPKSSSYKWYGARGITVCEHWRAYENFYADMGDRPAGLSIERLNNDLGYSLSNCKWATIQEQASNQRHPGNPKTHCKLGHELTPENSLWSMKRGRRERRCRECGRISHRAWVARQKAAA